MPVKITPAGGYAYRRYQCVDTEQITSYTTRHTRATAPPMVAEKALMTFTVGSNHFVNLSSPLPLADWSKSGICCRRMIIISSGESQD